MKGAQFFSHDYNSRNDPKLVKLFMKSGMQGLGVFWCIIEMIYEQGGKLMLSECERIAFELRVDKDVILSIINDYDLFEKDEVSFWSESALKRIDIRNDKSKKASESANTRWNSEGNAKVMRTHSEGNAKVMRTHSEGNAKKGYNKKENKIKEEEIKKEYVLFYSSYPLKKSKQQGLNVWQRMSEEEKKLAAAAVKDFAKSCIGKEDKYIKHISTWLNQKCWEDEIKIEAPIQNKTVIKKIPHIEDNY